MDYEKKKPTADCIVARLVPSWGSIVSLLFKTTEPYTHYYDEHGEEVPYGAIASWTDVELPPEPESEDERIRKTLIHIVKGACNKYGIKYRGEEISEEKLLAYLERQKETGIQWLKSDNVKNPDKPYIDKAGMFYTTDGRMCHVSEIEKQKEPADGDFARGYDCGYECCLHSHGAEWFEKQKEQNPELVEIDNSKENIVFPFNATVKSSGKSVTIIDGQLSIDAKQWIKFCSNSIDGFKVYNPKELLIQKKEQKPVSGSSEKPNNHKEWSEEDDALLKEIVSFFKDGTVKLQHDLDLYAGFLEKKFKSLRPQPHWKPSGEQMKALEDVIKCELSAGMYARAGILQTLQNDLKKL